MLSLSEIFLTRGKALCQLCLLSTTLNQVLPLGSRLGCVVLYQRGPLHDIVASLRKQVQLLEAHLWAVDCLLEEPLLVVSNELGGINSFGRCSPLQILRQR